MDDPKNSPLSQDSPFSTPGDDRSKPFWVYLAMAVGFLAVVVAALFFFGHQRPDPNARRADPYLPNLKISEMHVSFGEDFAGNRITYVEGKISNTGNKKIIGATIELLFKNPLGELAQQEDLPVMVLLFKEPYEDYGSLEQAPLSPGQTRDFRLTIEHLSRDWDHQLPQVKMVGVNY